MYGDEAADPGQAGGPSAVMPRTLPAPSTPAFGASPGPQGGGPPTPAGGGGGPFGGLFGGANAALSHPMVQGLFNQLGFSPDMMKHMFGGDGTLSASSPIFHQNPFQLMMNAVSAGRAGTPAAGPVTPAATSAAPPAAPAPATPAPPTATPSPAPTAPAPAPATPSLGAPPSAPAQATMGGGAPRTGGLGAFGGLKSGSLGRAFGFGG